VILTLIVLAASACKSGGGSDDTSREIGDAELSQMVLELGQFGPEYTSFAPDAENGVVNVEAAAKDDFDPANELADLLNYGYLSGVDSFYSSNSGGPGGTFFLGSQVALFRTVEGATGYLEDSAKEIKNDIGKTSSGVTLLEAEKLDFDAGADAAIGIRGIARFSHEDGTSTDVWIVVAEYRRGRLLGAVATYAIAPNDLEKTRLQGKVESLAGVMNSRMAAVLAAAASATATAEPAAAEGGY
jgi:hypothetical protein